MSSPLKILQIIPSISLVYGGPSQMVRGLSTALAEQGAAVTVLTTDSNGDIDQPPLDVPLSTPLEENGYQVLYFRCSPFRRYKFSLGMLQWLAQNAASYDLAHIHALFCPVRSAAATIARLRGLPYILRPLGTLDPADLRKKRKLKQIYVSLLEGSNIAGAAALHFTSPQEAKVSERFGHSTHDLIIPLGVSHTVPAASEAIPTQTESVRDRFGIPSQRPLILFMSRIDPKKGLDLLLPALERLVEQGVDFHFVLSGANPQDPHYEQQIQTRVQTSCLAERTTITGFVSGELKAALLRESDLFVLPSYYENFGIAVAEAMLAAKPVVISDGVYIWEDIKTSHSGWISACEVNSLTQALSQALQSEPERRQRGLNAKNYALEHYSWPAIAHQTLQAYEQILRAVQ